MTVASDFVPSLQIKTTTLHWRTNRPAVVRMVIRSEVCGYIIRT